MSRLHLLSIAGTHGREIALRVEEAEKRGHSLGENPILDEVLRKDAREKKKLEKTAAKEKAKTEGDKNKWNRAGFYPKRGGHFYGRGGYSFPHADRFVRPYTDIMHSCLVRHV